MSEETPAATPAPAPAVLTDENGQPLSKNELKRRLKAERAAKQKAEKEAAKVCLLVDSFVHF